MPDDRLAAVTVPAARRIYCNRTLNLRSIAAIGYDMDYTLVHYRVDHWERRAYDQIRRMLMAEGWPVEQLQFDPSLVTRGLVIDTELGNIVKANRFGFVMRASHGTRAMSFEEQREVYRNFPIDLAEARFHFLNTLFSLSGSCLFAQLVDLYDQRRFPEILGYSDLFQRIHRHLDTTHLEGTLKAEIVADPGTYIDVDPDAPLALLDQLRSGKRLLIITNAEWSYVRTIMAYAFDRFLPKGMTWRDLFELVIVGARKPDFFSARLPLFSIVDEERGHLTPAPQGFPGPGCYVGGDANSVEKYLGLSGSEILYVGDHIFADVRMSKPPALADGLILRELKTRSPSWRAFRPRKRELAARWPKERLEAEHARTRLDLQRASSVRPRPASARCPAAPGRAQERILGLDQQVAPLAREASQAVDARWGPLLRAGHDKSHLARQVEASADIYTSRVSNFLFATPFAYLRAGRGSMPHDPILPHQSAPLD
jgi:HAD superfamily 5'-nucleotidase-like hydrolase